MRNKKRETRTVTANPAQSVGTGSVLDVAAPKAPSGNSAATSSAMRLVAPGASPSLIRSTPGFMTSPFGQSYQMLSARPLPDDEIQGVIVTLDFDLKGYKEATTNTLFPTMYNGMETQLNSSYEYLSQICRMYRKPRLNYSTIADGSLMKYLNLYVTTLANLATLINLSKLYQFNDAYRTLLTNLWSYTTQLQMLWSRLNAIVVPGIFKQMGLERGTPFFMPRSQAPVIRLYSWRGCNGSGSGTTFNDYINTTYTALSTLFTTAANITVMIADIESAIVALEGTKVNNDTAGALAIDFRSIRQVFDFMATVEEGSYRELYTQALPAIADLPGIDPSPQKANGMFCRMHQSYDTKGASADIHSFFPVWGMTEFMSKIPIKGYGSQVIEDFTFLGMPKFAILDSTAGLRYADQSTELLIVGTDTYHLYNAVTASAKMVFSQFTREDGWVDNLTNYGVDWGGTASDINTGLNLQYWSDRHTYRFHRHAAQLTTNIEFRWVDEMPVDWTFWMDPEDLAGNSIIYIARSMGLPHLK